MILQWPEDLPRPERESWQSKPQDARLKRQNEAGPPGYRRRFSSVATIVNLSLVLTRHEKAVFDAFFAEDTAHGSRLFTMPDPTTDGWTLLTDAGAGMLTADGAPILLSATWLCSFGDQTPSESLQGLEFLKTFSVVVLP